VPSVAPVSERRLVSVLFADLVGFTPLAESRDPEEVRELLSRYFESCRRLIELYGGSVEKFIGDAVMAVWGTPVAQEDDAERAVRAALDLVAAVSALGDEVGASDLRARAGVLTGEAAVNVGAVGEGMVAGDLVNTAARVQAAAAPGTVLVGDATRRSSEAAVVFEPAGEHELKGKAEPMRLYRAVRVTAARGGALRSTGLEAPFVGRERELRLVKELFHASAEQSRAHLVTITGTAGIGKSRLAWEFFKYLDGLAEEAWWHRGRCLAYGEGVAYWALAEMVRARVGIVEGEEQVAARAKLSSSLDEHLPDPDERAWVEPRLANLLGLEERVDDDRQDLFAAWRLFFERLADRYPVILVFEDLQWADQALLAFIEYLLEWSGSQRLYVLALARPELAAQSPDFARAVRNAATLALEPISDEAMAKLLDGYVPGLPAELRQQVLARAQGVPLYAVETVRMLLDRGLLVEQGSVYTPTGEIGELEVPETLHALVAARLDGLDPEERQLVQHACVLGKTFTRAALAALTGRVDAELDPLLSSLVRKEVLSVQADPRSSERGQYAFLQELLRQVAYETLSRRDRKARHLAAVAALEESFHGVEQDVPEVLATHLLAAHSLSGDDPDAGELKVRARDALAGAAERAASLAAPDEGQHYLDQAAALADDDAPVRADLLERAGRLAFQAGQPAQARERLEQAIALFEELGDAQAAARAGVGLADVEVAEIRLEEATRRLEASLATLEEAGPSEELAGTLAQLGRVQLLRGQMADAAATLERALLLAEGLALNEVLVHALTSRAVVLNYDGRYVEARMLLEGALAHARVLKVSGSASWRTANNLILLFQDTDSYAEAIELSAEVEAQARQRGDREQLAVGRLGAMESLVALGLWQDALERVAEADDLQASLQTRGEAIQAAPVLCERGEAERAKELLTHFGETRESEQADAAAAFAGLEARVLRAQGHSAEALLAAERGLFRTELGLTNSYVKRCLVEACEAAFDLDDLAKVDELLARLDTLQPGQFVPSLRAHGFRIRARLDARREGLQVDQHFRAAEALFRERALAFYLAVTQVEHAEWLTGRGENADALLTEARAAFERLEATPWIERVDAVTGGVAPSLAATSRASSVAR
jgi:class 3 adenylate cyclase/predicted ATPase